MKRRFVIVGSGWRAMYYVRIAKALPEVFELSAMLCRTEEKADRIHNEMGIHTTTSIAECEAYQPDFVVVVVDKASIYNVSKEWMAKGFTVLCETPAALNLEDLHELWRLRCEEGYKLCVAEQYTHYPTYLAMIAELKTGIIGEPYNVTVSLAHEYHGASLLRTILEITDEPFVVYGKRYSFPVAETFSRYEMYTDGRMADKNRDRLTIEFANGKAAFYDFCSEQYRSPIRNNYIHVQGERGELKDNIIYFLDEENRPQAKEFAITSKQVITGDENPNLNKITEILNVSFDNQNRYQSRYGECGLSEDETAIAMLMEGAARYHKDGTELYPLADALQDAYMAILMKKAIEHPGEVIQSEPQPWN